ncbi:hypothetical protein [Clostridium transplantifaecale]|uniref:hypothetical protein n=1 Tax=Clostridium transplantifaecale TaxID=2479838 RepID=UPI000F645144|nr:hypothetical protein [Clostridium transplantifaecale]
MNTRLRALEQISMILKHDNIETLSVLKYVNSLCENYSKILMLDKMESILKEKQNTTFFLAKGLYPLGPENTEQYIARAISELYYPHPLSDYSSKEYFRKSTITNMDESDIEYSSFRHHRYREYEVENVTAFYDSFVKKARPIVFSYSEDPNKDSIDNLSVLFDYQGSSAIKLTTLTHNSPPQLGFIGVVNIFREIFGLYYDKQEDRRAEERLQMEREEHLWREKEHQATLRNQELQSVLYRERIKILKQNAQKSTPDDYALNIEQIADTRALICDKQNRLNEQYRVIIEDNQRIDIKA